MTDVLISLQTLLRSGTIAVALVGFAMPIGRFRRHNRFPRLPTLEYRPISHIVLLASIFFAAEFLATNSIAPLRSMPWQAVLVRMVGALELPVLLVGLVLAYREAQLANAVSYLLSGPGPAERGENMAERVAWPLAGFVALVATFLFLEHKLPYYFTQDDNLAVNLAEILQGCRSLFQGVFPTWNPFQFMGSPNTTLGWYSLTYPPTYLCYWIARTVLGNENAALELLVIFHLLAGYFLLYWAIRREGCRPSVAMLGSSCCMVSGFALIFSRSWYQFSAVLPWMALLLVCVQELARSEIGWKWILAYGAVIGVAFHAGHIQMWAYSVMLADLAIALLICVHAVPVRAMAAVVAAHFLALAIAAPLLVPEFLSTGNVLRYPDSRGIAAGIIGLFVPATVRPTPHPLPGWAGIGQPSLIGEMYYSGTLFVALVAVLLASVLASRWTKQTVRDNRWVLCALVAFLLALGDRGLLWDGLMQVPGFNRFRWPFKFLGYVVLFACLAGAVALERLMRNKRWSLRVEVSLAAVLWAVLAYHVTLCTAAFYSYGFHPYPKPDPALSARLTPRSGIWYPKVLPIGGPSSVPFQDGGYRSPDPDFISSYMNQWPTVLGAFSIDGYNPLVSFSPPVRELAQRYERKPARALYEYGVQYVLQYDVTGQPTSHRWQGFDGAKVVYENPRLVLQELPKPRPMAFPLESPGLALPVRFDGAGATITTSGLAQGGWVILNMLWRSEFRVTTGDKRLPAGADAWGRIAVLVPQGTNDLRVTFRPPWEYGFALALVALACGLPIGWWSVRAPAIARVADPEQMELLETVR